MFLVVIIYIMVIPFNLYSLTLVHYLGTLFSNLTLHSHEWVMSRSSLKHQNIIIQESDGKQTYISLEG